MTTLKPGDVGAGVRELQRLLALRGFDIALTSEYDGDTAIAVRQAQQRYGLVVDGLAGPKTLAALTNGARLPGLLGAADLQRAADRLGVPLAAIRAVNEVESRGSGFLSDGRPVILFERHIMYRQLSEALSPAQAAHFAILYPGIVSPQRGGYAGGAGEHMRLAAAIAIDRDCALCAASWGLFQIMGYHWRRLGYTSVQAFAEAMRSGEGAQLDAFVCFIETDPALHKALAARKWATFAAGYNGPAYKDNLYDVKLTRAFARYQAEDGAHA